MTIDEVLSAGGAPLEVGRTRESCVQAHGSGRVYPLQSPELGGRELPSVYGVLQRMLAKRPERRYPHLAECKREFAAAGAQQDVESEG